MWAILQENTVALAVAVAGSLAVGWVKYISGILHKRANDNAEATSEHQERIQNLETCAQVTSSKLGNIDSTLTRIENNQTRLIERQMNQ